MSGLTWRDIENHILGHELSDSTREILESCDGRIAALEAELARVYAQPTVAQLIDGRAAETLGSMMYDTGTYDLVIKPAKEG